MKEERRGSLYVPRKSSQESEGNSDDEVYKEDVEQLNRFLHLRDVSPVRRVLSVPWDSAKEITRRLYVRKVKSVE